MLVSIHVVGQVARELLEQLHLGSQLQLHLEYVTFCRLNHGIELQSTFWTWLGGHQLPAIMAAWHWKRKSRLLHFSPVACAKL